MKKKKAFTLSEVLVTMGIIGVIAAITLPVLIQGKPNQELVMLKKAYYNTARIVSELINDEDLYPEREGCPEGISVCEGFANIEIEDLIGHEAESNGNTYSGATKFCGLFAAKMGQTNLDCSDFTTNDEITWKIPEHDFQDGEPITIIVNVRAHSGNNCTIDDELETEPNCGGSAPDTFGFRVNKFGDIEIIGPLARAYIASESTNKSFSKFVKELHLNL